MTLRTCWLSALHATLPSPASQPYEVQSVRIVMAGTPDTILAREAMLAVTAGGAEGSGEAGRSGSSVSSPFEPYGIGRRGDLTLRVFGKQDVPKRRTVSHSATGGAFFPRCACARQVATTPAPSDVAERAGGTRPSTPGACHVLATRTDGATAAGEIIRPEHYIRHDHASYQVIWLPVVCFRK